MTVRKKRKGENITLNIFYGSKQNIFTRKILKG
jgi:hypothetical protein